MLQSPIRMQRIPQSIQHRSQIKVRKSNVMIENHWWTNFPDILLIFTETNRLDDVTLSVVTTVSSPLPIIDFDEPITSSAASSSQTQGLRIDKCSGKHDFFIDMEH